MNYIRENKKNEVNRTKSKTTKAVEINGIKYMRDSKTGKLYTMPRTVTTRKIVRNRLRILLKQRGFSKVNKIMSNYWKRADVQEELRNSNF